MRRILVFPVILFLFAVILPDQPVQSEISKFTEGIFPDFDNDGFGDGVIGVPFESYTGSKQEGGFHVFYGSPGGFSTNRNQFFRGKNFLSPSLKLGFAFVGSSFAAGDANDDGFDELFASIPGLNQERGAVGVFWGGPDGLRANRFSLLDLGTDAKNGDRLGATSLYSARLNGDRGYDLVASLAFRDIGSNQDAGAFAVFYNKGQEFEAPKIFTQNSPGVKGGPQEMGLFGLSLTGGYFMGNDDFYDLAVGAPNFTGAKGENSGAVYVFQGTQTGIKTNNHRFFVGSAAGNLLGFAMTPLPVRKDFDHLAVSALGASNFAGNVYTFDVQAKKKKLVFSGQFPGDFAGFSLGTGVDRNDPFRPFLGIGAKGVDLGSVQDAGAVFTAKYNAAFTFTPFNRFQSFGFTPKKGDEAGVYVNYTNYNGIRPDLNFGIDLADVSGKLDVGGVGIIDIVGFKDIIFLTQNTANVKESAQKGDRFGLAGMSGVSYRFEDGD